MNLFINDYPTKIFVSLGLYTRIFKTIVNFICRISFTRPIKKKNSLSVTEFFSGVAYLIKRFHILVKEFIATFSSKWTAEMYKTWLDKKVNELLNYRVAALDELISAKHERCDTGPT